MRTSVKVAALLCAVLSPAAMAAWDGVIDWAQRTALSTATSGVVETVSVRPGERVAKGKLLLALEQESLQAEVERTRAAVAQNRLLYDEAKRELARTEELYARTLLADRDLNLARISHAEADAALQQSLAEYSRAKEQLRNSRLTAPFDALVLATPVRAAETVVTRLQAAPQVIVAAADRMAVRFEVESAELAQLAPGTEVEVAVNGKRYSGAVEAVLLDGVAAGKPVVVEVSFASAGQLLPGERATVELP